MASRQDIDKSGIMHKCTGNKVVCFFTFKKLCGPHTKVIYSIVSAKKVGVRLKFNNNKNPKNYKLVIN